MYQIPDGLPTLSRESHLPDSGFACVMEYISVITGDEWGDHPKCTEPLIGCVAIMLNDAIQDDGLRGRVLVPRIGRIVGTAVTAGVDRMAYKRALTMAVRAIDHATFDSMWARGTDLCNCGLCENRVEMLMHGVSARIINRLNSMAVPEGEMIERLTAVLDEMLDVADTMLGRTRRETDTAQRLATFVHEWAYAR